MGEFLGSRNYDSVYFRRKTAVRISYGAFRLEIYHVPDSADNMSYAEFSADIHGEGVVSRDPDSFQPCSGLPDDFGLRLRGKMPSFVYVYPYGYDYLVEHGQCAFENIEMTCRERIE